MKGYFKMLIIMFLLLATEATHAQKVLDYLRSEESLSNIEFNNKNYQECKKHCINIVNYYTKNKKQCLKNNEATFIVFNSFHSLGVLSDFTDITSNDRIAFLKEALSICENNKAWLASYENKYSIVTLYQIYANYLLEYDSSYDVSNIINKMIKYGEIYCRADINEVLLVAASIYSVAHQFERNYPIYQRLYGNFENLDNQQKYKTIKELIHFEFKKKNYPLIIEYAENNKQLIRRTNDEVKESVLYFIVSAYNEVAYRHEAIGNNTNDFSACNKTYLEGYDYAKQAKAKCLPYIIINRAYSLYTQTLYKSKAIELFEEYIDCALIAQTNKDEEMLKYFIVEDLQQALISIILNTPSEKATQIKTKFNSVISSFHLTTEGEYSKDLELLFNNI